MAVVTPDRVRNRVNLSSSDIADSIVTEIIVNACAEVMLETGLQLIVVTARRLRLLVTDLAALYCLTYLTGGSASGTSFTLGDLSVKEVTGGVETPSPAFLQQCVLKLIERLRKPYLGRVELRKKSFSRGFRHRLSLRTAKKLHPASEAYTQPEDKGVTSYSPNS